MAIEKPFRHNKETNLAPPGTEESKEKILNFDYLSAFYVLARNDIISCSEVLCLGRSKELGRQGIPVAVCNGVPRGLDRLKLECVDRLRERKYIKREMDS